MAASTKVSDMCRLCGTDTLNVVRHHIFEGEGQVKKSAQKISECLPLHIAAEDPLPKNICGECSYKLDLMSDFREKAVKTDVMLVSLVEGVKPEIPDDDDDGPDHEIDNDFRSDTPVEQPEQQTEPEVLIKEEEAQQPQQPEKRPGRKAANKRPIQESDMEEEEEEAPAKKRGRKPKEKETAPAASATTSASTNPPKENTGPLPVIVRPEPGPQPVIGEIAYQCSHCFELFKMSRDAKLHIIEAHKYKCSTCRYRGSTEADLEKHMENHPAQVEKENLHRCCICLRSCISREAYTNHMKLHVGSLPYECEKCDLLFPNKPRLENHMTRHVCLPRKQGGVYVRKALKQRVAYQKKTVQYKGHECSICQQRFLRRDDMRNHKRRFHARAKEIARSERVARNSNLAKKKLNANRRGSLLSAKKPRKFDCPCGETFTQLDVLLRHRAKSHPDWIHACQRCERMYTTPMQLASHIDRAHPASSYECNECKEKLKTMVGMLNHREKRCPLRKGQVNAPTSLGKFTCDICMKVFESKAEIEVHVMLHLHKIKNIMKEISKIEGKNMLLATTPPKAAAQNQGKKKSNFVQCPSCDMNVPAFQWKMHQVLHDNPNRPKCAKCNFVTVTQGKMLAHTNSHLDTEAPFSCSVCHLNFREKYWAEKHTSAYHGNKARVKNNFEVTDPAAKQQNKLAKVKACPMCTESFSDPLSYQTHLLAHKQVQSFQKCKHCDTRIRGFDMMVTHLKLQHCLHVTVPLNCPMCNLLLNNRFSLNRHLTSMHPSCSYCRQMQSSKAALVSHISMRHPDMLPFSPLEDDTTVKVEPPETSPPAVEVKDAEPPSRNTIDALKNFVATKGNIASNSVGNGVEQNSAAASQQLPALVPISDQKQTKAKRPSKPKIPKQAVPPESNVAETQNIVKIESAQDEGSDLNGAGLFLKSNSRNRNTCHICGMRFKTIGECSNHLINEHNVCRYCSKNFETAAEMQTHMDNHPTLSCPCCSIKHTDPNKMHIHILRSHQDGNACCRCFKVLKNREDLKAHYELEHDSIVQCPTCDHFMHKNNITSHVRTKHGSIANYKCAHCSRVFKTKASHDLHIRIHTGETPYECPICVQKFIASHKMAKHVVVSHKFDEKRPIQTCPWCNTKLRTIIELGKHVTSSKACSEMRDSQSRASGSDVSNETVDTGSSSTADVN
ncbi:zinc finger protein Xfin-like isoform X1 [Cloeon dipterum]|uniref:zinc finger protein Xfin-like isoform X1 n=1 Tax=Cloeon dipterum TaxID=197152 RepID=UPI00321F977F